MIYTLRDTDGTVLVNMEAPDADTAMRTMLQLTHVGNFAVHEAKRLAAEQARKKGEAFVEPPALVIEARESLRKDGEKMQGPDFAKLQRAMEREKKQQPADPKEPLPPVEAAVPLEYDGRDYKKPEPEKDPKTPPKDGDGVKAEKL